jgi:transcription termination/antitermination protein NusA
MALKLDTELIRLISLFEKITRSKVRDCFYFKDKLVFMVEKGEMPKALGKNKGNIFKIEKLVKKKIKIMEYSSEMLQFIINLFAPLKVQDINEEENIVTITGPDTKTKGLMIGAQAQNLRAYETIAKQYFPQLEEIKVV